MLPGSVHGGADKQSDTAFLDPDLLASFEMFDHMGSATLENTPPKLRKFFQAASPTRFKEEVESGMTRPHPTRVHSCTLFSTHIHLRAKNGMLLQGIGLALQKEILNVAVQCLVSEKNDPKKSSQSAT